jgi:hypothetical protein
VHEHGVGAHGKHLNAQLLELGVFLGDRRDLGGSNKGEIARIEAEHHPFAQKFAELH